MAVAYHFNHPYKPKEKLKAINLLRTKSFEYVAHRFHCSIQTLYRWKKQFNGKLDSLENGSHVPHTKNPKAHTEEEIKNILAVLKRNPHVGLNELYSKLRVKYAYSRNPVSLYRLLKKMGYYDEVKKINSHIPKKYDTPEFLGEKFQLDVKFVPKECRSNNLFDKNFYQYTIIDEASRERFIYAYDEHTPGATVDFVKRAILFYGYVPKIIQTDNGAEFTYLSETTKKHPFDCLCEELGIEHKLIKPRTPRHNGKVERSHRNDNERFYCNLKFYSLDDLNKQMKAYLKRSNSICSSALKTKIDGKVVWLSPNEKREMLINELKNRV